jgi:hypothetical protein
MKILEGSQGTPEWWEAKKGIPSASNFDRILTAKTLKPSAQQDDFICELIADTICQLPNYFTEQGKPVNSYAIQAGIDREPAARRWFELEANLTVRQVMLCKSDDERFACSPDGLVTHDGQIVGGLELKCPLPKTHVQYLMGNGLPAEYRAQVHGSLIVTGLPLWFFMSYTPPLPPLLVKVEPDDFTMKLREELDRFYIKYQQALAHISKMV